MGLFILGVVVGLCSFIPARDALKKLTFWYLLGAVRRKKQRETREGIEKLNKFINSQDWNDDD